MEVTIINIGKVHTKITTSAKGGGKSLEGDELIFSLLQEQGTYDDGFRLLVQTYSERLYQHVRRMVGTHEDANDVLQDCFLKVYRNISRFEQNSKLFTWLYRIATNESLTFLEKRKRNRTSSFDGQEATWHGRMSTTDNVDGDKTVRALEAAIATLPSKQKAVFNLRYYEEMSYADMSAALETSEGALKASYHHAVKKIEAFIKENMDKL